MNRSVEVIQFAVLVHVHVGDCVSRELRSTALNSLSEIYRPLKGTKGRPRVNKETCKVRLSMNSI